mgnify:CR=1 FL=1
MVRETRDFYESVGLEPIPLLTNKKETDLERWQLRTPNDLWQEVAGRAGRYDNIGVRAGQGVAIIDCDDVTTATAVLQHLAGLGFGLDKFPLVQSASGDGRHIYIELDNDTYGNYMHLGDGLSGELRFGSGAYCVAPHSAVDGAAYELIAGEWQQRPHVTWSDLSPLLGRAPGQTAGVNRLPVPLLRRDLSRVFYIRLNWLKSAGRGASYEQYKSRSEVEFALLMSLARNGHQHNEAVALFEKLQPGHYAESRARHKYLDRSWQHAVELIAATQPRPAIAKHYAEVQAWSSWQYDTDRRVYSAVVSLAYEAATWSPAAAQRDLMMLTGVSCRKTVRRSLERLRSNGLLRRLDHGFQTKATVYEVLGQHAPIGHNIATLDYVLSYGGGLSIENESSLWSALGGSTRPVYAALIAHGALTDREVAEVIDKHYRTAQRALNVLRRHGLVSCHLDGRWCKTSVSLADVADRLGVAETVKEQRKRIKQDRRQFKEALEYWSTSGGGEHGTKEAKQED